MSAEAGRTSFARRAMRGLWRLATDAPYRGELHLRLARPAGAFQPFNHSRPDRYPRIFSFVGSQLGADSKGPILSFGCSTGEEVFSLRRHFPHAFIKGIDINPGNIAICERRRRSAADGRIEFATANSPAAEQAASYDAIFCMAVLRHGGLGAPGVTRCDHLIRFEDFAEAVEGLARCLKPGGLLAIRHSNFRFCDAPAAARFETVLRVPYSDRNGQPLFGPDNRLMLGANYPDTVFRKLA